MVRFHPGNVVINAMAAHALGVEDEADIRKIVSPLLDRHVAGDWGDLCSEDKRANESALKTGARILSRYNNVVGNVNLYFITDGVYDGDTPRQLTTILRPEDY